MFLEWVKYNHETWKLLLDSGYNHYNIVKQFVTKFSLLCWLIRSYACSMWTQVPDKTLCLVVCKLFCFMFLEYSFFYSFSLYGNIFLTKRFFGSYVLSWARRFFSEPNICVFFRSHVYFRRKVCYLFTRIFVRFLKVFSCANSFLSCCPEGIFYSLIYVVSSVWERPKNMIL